MWGFIKRSQGSPPASWVVFTSDVLQPLYHLAKCKVKLSPQRADSGGLVKRPMTHFWSKWGRFTNTQTLPELWRKEGMAGLTSEITGNC